MSAPDAEEVFALRQRYWQHGFRPLAVWGPDQRINDKGEPLNSPGKQPRGRWREDASRDPPEAVRTYPDPRALNTGLLCGDAVAFDVDVLDQELTDQIINLIERTLGQTPLVRIGRAPKVLLVYRPEHRFAKVQTPELFFLDGTKARVELLAEGQQFVADGIHPDTGEPYTWTEGTPADVPVDELPVVSEEQAHAIITEAERLLRAAGGKEKEKPRSERMGAAGDFFSQVNTAALADIAAWARSLFPLARFEPGTGAWRVSSKDLGRDLEEDISIHPEGIQDWGEEEAQSPIDLVMRYGVSFTTAVDAALWLCERLGINPTSLGYRKKREKTDDDDGQPKPPPWTLTRPSDWADREIEPRIFVMEDWIPLGEYVGLYGVGGVRKTDFLLQGLMASSAGLPFCGIPMMHCVTLGLFCEDTEEEIIRRVDRIAAFYGRKRADFTGFFFASLVGTAQTEFVNFDTGEMAPQHAFHEFERQIAVCGAGLAALDTMADFFGGEEINRRQVSQFMRLLNGCCMRNRCAILGSRHPSQRGRSTGTFDSGSTGWEGKERARLTLRDPAFDQDEETDKKPRAFAREPSNKRILTLAKSNYAKPGVEIELVFENGGFERTWATQGTIPKRGQMRDLAADAKFLELLSKTSQQGRWVHDAVNNPNRYAPAVFASDPDHGDFSKAEFKRAMTRLFGARRLKLEWTGNTRTGHNQLIEVNQ